jgi:hypothetical protein
VRWPAASNADASKAQRDTSGTSSTLPISDTSHRASRRRPS